MFEKLARASLAWLRTLVISVIGTTVVLIGIVMIVTPGPAVVVIPLGLAILSVEFAWARVLLKKAKKYVTDRLPPPRNQPPCPP